MIIYFTGTGNSRHLAEIMADKLHDQLEDAGAYIKSGKKAEFNSKKPFVFVCPVYGWQMPHIFRKFIMESVFSGNHEAYFVITCGGDIGCAGERAEELCREKGFIYKGTAEVVMPENYIALFKAPDEPEAAELIAAAEIKTNELSEYIAEGREFEMRKTGFSDKLKSGPVNSIFYKFIIKAKPFHVTDKCISCGLCEKLCPLNNISMKSSRTETDANQKCARPVWGDSCTHCMACICGCPEEAVEYGNKTKHKRRHYLK